jgi:hypothetical protein
MNRAERICRAHLYVRSSHLKRYRQRRSRYEIPIGNGLFSSRDIPCNTHIVYFVGELLTDPVEIRKRSAQSNQGGYIVGNATKTATFDCCETSIGGQCLASMSNCPFECYNTTRDRPAYDNARLTYKACGKGHNQWGLMSKKTIPAHEEILMILFLKLNIKRS